MANDLINETFESGTANATLTTVNTSATSFNGVAPTFSTTRHQGELSAQFTTVTAASSARFEHVEVASAWYVFRIYITALPAASQYLATFQTAAGINIGDLRINSAGTLTIRNNITAVVTTTNPLALNTWHRIAIKVVPNTTNGLTLKTYTGANVNGTTPDENLSGNSTVAGPVQRLVIGNTTVSTFDLRVDQIEGSSTDEPSGAAATVPGAVTNLAGTAGNTQVPLTWTAPANGGSPITDYIVQYRIVP